MKAFFLVMGILLSATTRADMKVWGAGVQVGNGLARTYIKLDCDGKTTAIGIGMQGAALDGLPSQMHMYDYILPMPEYYKLSPFEHVMVNWNPHGHDPVEIYGAPHFDFHFYTISNDDRMKITCMGDDEAVCLKDPGSDYEPQYFAPTPAGVPQMGWHWIDTRSGEFHGQPFTATMIYGFYDGKIAFVEPMITRDFMLSKTPAGTDFPTPAKVHKTGSYPTHYDLTYDSVQDMYFIEMNKLVPMQGDTGT